MAIVIDRDTIKDHKDLLADCRAFRDRMEGEESGLMLGLSIEGKKSSHDPFDGEGAVHFVIERDDAIAAYCRFLPTSKPHPASLAFPHFLGVEDYPHGPGIGEIAPLIVRSGGEPLAQLNRQLFDALLDYCSQNQIWCLIFAVKTEWLAWFLKSGYEVYPLGLPRQIGSRVVVPLRMRVPVKLAPKSREQSSLTLKH